MKFLPSTYASDPYTHFHSFTLTRTHIHTHAHSASVNEWFHSIFNCMFFCFENQYCTFSFSFSVFHPSCVVIFILYTKFFNPCHTFMCIHLEITTLTAAWETERGRETHFKHVALTSCIVLQAVCVMAWSRCVSLYVCVSVVYLSLLTAEGFNCWGIQLSLLSFPTLLYFGKDNEKGWEFLLYKRNNIHLHSNVFTPLYSSVTKIHALHTHMYSQTNTHTYTEAQLWAH